MLKKLIIINKPTEINIKRIKKLKAVIILRENRHLQYNQKLINLLKRNQIKYFAYNHLQSLIKYKSNFLYISSYNQKSLKHLKLLNNKLFILGAAHNYQQIFRKINQGCDAILLSRIFKSQTKLGFLGLQRFCFLQSKFNIDFYALGGINKNNIKKLNLIKNLKGFCVMSAYQDTFFNF